MGERSSTRVVADREPGSSYVGRAGRGEDGTFGNPFSSCAVCSRCRAFHSDGASTLPCFEAYFLERVARDGEFRRAVLGLRGKALWCPGRCVARGQRCHAQIIAKWIGEAGV